VEVVCTLQALHLRGWNPPYPPYVKREESQGRYGLVANGKRSFPNAPGNRTQVILSAAATRLNLVLCRLSNTRTLQTPQNKSNYPTELIPASSPQTSWTSAGGNHNNNNKKIIIIMIIIITVLRRGSFLPRDSRFST
jgi:hypothetical protein